MEAFTFSNSANLSFQWTFGQRKRSGEPTGLQCSFKGGIPSPEEENYCCGGFSTSSQSLPLCLKIVVVSFPSLRRKPVASSTLSKANRICSPSTASTGWFDITTVSPIRPANIASGITAHFVRGRARYRQCQSLQAKLCSTSLTSRRFSDVAILDTWSPRPEEGAETLARAAKLLRARSMLGQISMMTILLVLGSIWMVLSLVFCLALCAAAARPLSECEVGVEVVEPRLARMRADDVSVLCLR